MIHIATIHWKTNRWLEIQLRYLRKNITQAFVLHAVVTNNDENATKDEHLKLYFRSEKKSHSENLSFLCSNILNISTDNDYLMFLDGDAFPITKLPDEYFNIIKTNKLIAVQRLENNGDKQPHPCFTLTTASFWKEIDSNWDAGFHWKDKDGNMITDVGGNLLKKLIDKNINWHPLHRTNKKNLHPLFFGVYDNVIYHHGEGFRNGIGGRINRKNQNLQHENRGLLHKYLAFHVKNPFLVLLRDAFVPFFRKNKKIKNSQMKIKNDYFNVIQENPSFYKELI